MSDYGPEIYPDLPDQELADYEAAGLHDHKHKFVIPVEWDQHNVSNPNGKWPFPEKRFTVTKLRCECGEEIER